jgi:hypothetical protein
MPEWFFRERRARNACVEQCIQTMLEEAALSSHRMSLGIAAFRLHRRVAADGVMITFEQAFYRLRRRDRTKIFVREK